MQYLWKKAQEIGSSAWLPRRDLGGYFHCPFVLVKVLIKVLPITKNCTFLQKIIDSPGLFFFLFVCFGPEIYPTELLAHEHKDIFMDI